MASVASLGLHRPAGLQHAAQEQLLDPEAPVADDKWDVSCDGDQEDELLTTKDAVIWSRGGMFRRTFRFELEKEPIVQALLAWFPISQDDKTDTGAAGLERALVVFLRTQAHIYFLSGTSHVVHTPFEVEAAYAGAVGIIIQRRQNGHGVAPVSFKFPRAPNNSFVSSHFTAFSSSQQAHFSPERLGIPNLRQLGLDSTLDLMGDAIANQSKSHWPRLMTLTDPLLEFGLLVASSEGLNVGGPKKNKPKKPAFLDPAEEMLHIEHVRPQGSALASPSCEPLNLCITINRENGTYTVWRLTHLKYEDPFISRRKPDQSQAARRRSSMQPSFAGGSATPVQPSHRESFGAPLPGKRPRKSEKVEKPIDLVSSLEQQDKEVSSVTRRSSRRVSSMLARADLSASHDRGAYAEQPLMAGHAASKRHESLGSFHGRLSASQAQQIHPSLASLLEAPFDAGLDEGIHNMGLDDNDFEGLQHEVLLTKIHTFALNSSNLRYSTSTQPARTQAKVFIITAPFFAANDHQRTQLLIGIQDILEKRLQLLSLHVRTQSKLEIAGKGTGGAAKFQTSVSVTPGELRRVQNVVDSCRLVDGDQSVILVLSESQEGHHELTTQAPWSELTKITLPILFVDRARSLQYRGRAVDRDMKQKKSEIIDLAKGNVVAVRHPRQRGVVDILDNQGRLHQLRIQLQPTCPQAQRVLCTCRSVLPDLLGERVYAGWLHVMQWLPHQGESFTNLEWSAVTVLLLVLFLNLGQTNATVNQTTRLSVRRRRHASGSFGTIRESDDWRALEVGETANSLGCPPWMMNRGWQWALDEDMDDTMSPQVDQSFALKFISRHIALAKEYMSSPLGEAAAGAAGYLPTAASRPAEARRKAAVDMFMSLHLLLEEQKLDIMTPEFTSPGRADLRVIMCQVARWLKWQNFSSMYDLGIQEDIDARHDTELVVRPPLAEPRIRPDILDWIQTRLMGIRGTHYLVPGDLYYANARLSEAEKSQDKRWDRIIPKTLAFKRFFRILKLNSTAAHMVESMRDAGLTSHVLETLPEAALVPLRDAISLCQPHPPANWSKDLLDLVNRRDISVLREPGKRPRQMTSKLLTPTHAASWDFKLLCQSVDDSNNIGFDEGEGTERQAVIRALFKDDRRLNEAQDLLSTHKSRIIRLEPHPGWSESEYLDKQKEFVAATAIGTLAIPAGRGLLYYSLRYPLITQKLHIGGFNLNCVVKPMGNAVGVDKALFTEEKVCWGFFHQGVAAGLAISPQAKGIDTSWIIYNRPQQDLNNRHAGFLLALGLNGHLKGVAKWVAFKYLTPKHTMTSIGLLLGLAASYIGTMDSLITRLLSVHATRMLPRGAAELNLSHMTQTSAIMGIGLLYCGSQHRRMSEIMLSEIEHIDEEEEEDPLRTEGYRLAAGFALGFINLGKGKDLKGLHDMRLTEKLVTHATSTKHVDIVHVLDRSAAGAVMAIAFIFMKSEDHIVARKIDVPESTLQFDYVRPDILLLRTVAKNLILWSGIDATRNWIQQSLPEKYKARFGMNSCSKLRSVDLPFYSILAGLCFSIGLRYAGSTSSRARDILIYYLDHFIRLCRLPSKTEHPAGLPAYDEELTRANVRTCQDVVAISAALVMAGTGDKEVLRRLRSLHGHDSQDTPYGSHLAAHLAIGALFLGCGTATFGTSNLAIASMLVAFYPVFPNNVMDNRAHLQAFRHFWVLATEQRCLVTKDVLTGQPVSVIVRVKLRTVHAEENEVRRMTPCLLPPLDQIISLSTECGPEFWDVELDFCSTNFSANEALRKTFAETQSIYLRRRPPTESAFSSTLAALGKERRGADPFEWVFDLPSLREISYGDKATILQSGEQNEGGAGLGPSAVDVKLEMERGVLDGGDRERLEGARLLFEWGGARERMVAAGRDAAAASKGKAPEHESASAPKPETRSAWWMKDGDIESLKGKVWLAGRDAEQ